MATMIGKKSARGRRAAYSERIALAVCDRVMDGESLRAVCEDPAMPCRRTVYKWLVDHPGFFERYSRAREIRADDLFDAMDAIERAVLAGELNPNSARVALDSRKWRLARMSSRYADNKPTMEIEGDIRNIKTYAVREASPEAWDDLPEQGRPAPLAAAGAGDTGARQP